MAASQPLELGVSNAIDACTSTAPQVRPSKGDATSQSRHPMDCEDVQIHPRKKWRLILILVCLFLSLFIAALDQTTMATSVPTITAELHSAAGYTWIGSAYLLGNAAGGPIWAKLSDIWGRKVVLLTAIAWFFASSVFCALSKSIGMLITGRAFQGIAAGGLMQLVSIIVSDLFSMKDRALYLGLMEFTWCVAGGVGPLIGGAFAQYASWRWSYWVNLPVAGPTFFLLLVFLDVHNPRTGLKEGLKAIDWFGSALMLGLTLMVLLGLHFGGDAFPWDSPTVICLIVFGIVTSVLFVLNEKRVAKYPLMPMRVFRNPSNIATLIVAFLHGIVFISGEYFLPLYLQAVFSASAFKSGMLILPIIVSSSASGIFSGFIIHRTGRYKAIICISSALLTLATGLYIMLDVTSEMRQIIIFQVIAGIGSGALFSAPLIALQATVPQEDTATATATLGFARNVGESISVIIGGVVIQNCMKARSQLLLAEGVPPNITMAFSGGQATANIVAISSIDESFKLPVREAFSWSLQRMWIMFTCVSLVALIASVFITRKKLSGEHLETSTGLANGQREERRLETEGLDG